MLVFLIVGCSKYQKDLAKQTKRFISEFPDSYILPVVGYLDVPGAYSVCCNDDYKSLPTKIREAMKMALKLPDVHAVIKVDDDIAFNRDELQTLKEVLGQVQPRSYIGGGRGCTIGLEKHHGRRETSKFVHQTHYMYGGVTIFGRESARLISENTDMRCQLEDVTAGYVLTRKGIIPTSFGFQVRENERI